MSFKSTHARLVPVARLAAAVGGLGILFISVMVTIDVLLRKIVGITLGGATEISGMIFAVATAMAYPFVALDRANVRIDVVYTNVGPRARAAMDLVGMLVLLVFAALLTRSVYALFLKSWTGGTMSIGVVQVPLWFPQFFWFLGHALLTLTALFLSLYAIVGILRRDWATVQRVAGVPSIEETIEEETHLEVPPSPDGAASPHDGDAR